MRGAGHPGHKSPSAASRRETAACQAEAEDGPGPDDGWRLYQGKKKGRLDGSKGAEVSGDTRENRGRVKRLEHKTNIREWRTSLAQALGQSVGTRGRRGLPGIGSGTGTQVTTGTSSMPGARALVIFNFSGQRKSVRAMS